MTSAIQADDVIIGWAFELAGVAAMAFIASISEDIGNVMLLLIIGFWLLYLITNPTITNGINNFIRNAGTAAGGA